MKTFLLLTAFAALSSATGCLTLQPLGPMAKALGTKPGPTKSAETGALVTAAQDSAGGPILQKAPPPPIPAFLVTPGEVTAATAPDAVARLIREMEADRQALDSFPKYAEISVVGK